MRSANKRWAGQRVFDSPYPPGGQPGIVIASEDAAPVVSRAHWSLFLLISVIAIGSLLLVLLAVRTTFLVLSLVAAVGLLTVGVVNLLRAAH